MRIIGNGSDIDILAFNECMNGSRWTGCNIKILRVPDGITIPKNTFNGCKILTLELGKDSVFDTTGNKRIRFGYYC